MDIKRQHACKFLDYAEYALCILIDLDAESVFSVIEEFAGVLPFDDHASPEVIKREFGLSKNAFKRAVGHLMKEGKVEIRDKRIYIKK